MRKPKSTRKKKLPQTPSDVVLHALRVALDGNRSGSEIARLAGVSRQYVSDIRHGRRAPKSIDVLARIAKALGMSLAEAEKRAGS